MTTTLNQVKSTGYTLYLTNRSKSPKTIKSYLAHTNEYLSAYSNLTRENIISFKNILKQKGNSSKTINAKLSALKNYNEYLISTSQLSSTVIIPEDFIKIQQKQISPTKYDANDMTKLMNKVLATESKRNIALIYLLLSTGMRRAESINLKLSNINFAEESITFIGKGNKERTVYLNQKVISVLKDYINTERKYSRFTNSPYLFLSQRANKLNEETVNTIMKPYKINPHSLRHFFATNALQSGQANIVEIANLLGHSSLNTTNIYLHPTAKELKSKINKITFNI